MSRSLRKLGPWLLLLGGLWGTMQAEVGQSPAVSFQAPKTRLWLGRSQMVSFRVDPGTDEKLLFSFQADEQYLHVLAPPTLLPGYQIGYLRVRPVQAGQTQLIVAGKTLQIDIAPDPAADRLDWSKPAIVAPADSAYVWGKFTVGIERTTLAAKNPHYPVVLRLPDGTELPALPVPEQKTGPHEKFAVVLDASRLRVGANALLAVEKDPGGHERAGEPLYVIRLDPASATLVSGDCKDQLQGARPPHAGTVAPGVVEDDRKIEGSVIENKNEYPFWCLPVKIAQAGRYQMILTARGNIGGNALPTLGLNLDDANRAETTVRLATTDWQRIPLGHPIKLEAGDHTLSVRLRNAFGQGPNENRNLYLAHYELAPVDPPSGVPVSPSAPAGDGTMTETMSPMPPEATMQPQMMAAQPELTSAVMAPPGPFSVSFKDALDGQTIAGRVRIEAICSWPHSEKSQPPVVELLVNHQPAIAETSAAPQFSLDPGAFVAGDNQIELLATLPGGQVARSVAETIHLPPQIASARKKFPTTYCFTTFDVAWDKDVAGRLDAKDRSVANFRLTDTATLLLPESLEGDYHLVIDARGNAAPVINASLFTDEKETGLGSQPVSAAMAGIQFGNVHFEHGKKTLFLHFTSATPAGRPSARTVAIRAIRLEPANPKDSEPPVVNISYPAARQVVGLADAVVAHVADNLAVASADLLLDGQPQQFDYTPHNGFGSILFPLLTRQLKPGSHQVRIVARDYAGNVTQSEPITFQVEPANKTGRTTYQRDLFLLNRFAYGADPGELASLLTMGPRLWLTTRIAETSDSPNAQNEQRRLEGQSPSGQAVKRAMQYLLTASNPVQARFVMWAENHFSTWLNKVGPGPKMQEHERFVELGIAPFTDLLMASATSPAMLVYLDQKNSFAGHLNENYAREIMELHTLGVNDGYTQQDVTRLADILTGWSISLEAPRDGDAELEPVFRFDPHLNSGKASLLLGVEFPGVEESNRMDRIQMALEMLAAHPGCATFVSRKLVEHYVSDPAPPALVNDLARVFTGTGGDMGAMLLAISEHPDFWASRNKVASPIDFGVRSARLIKVSNPGPVMQLTFQSGMGLFDRATPDGYPDADGYFMSSNALLQRWRFAQTLQTDLITSGGFIPKTWLPADNAWTPEITQKLLDLVAILTTGDVLSPKSNEAALQVIAAAPPKTETRLLAISTFIFQLPEASLR